METATSKHAVAHASAQPRQSGEVPTEHVTLPDTATVSQAARLLHDPQDSRRGLFVTFEGGEATGKTTQSKLLAERLGALWTREPGGTALGAEIRELCLGERFDPSDVTELLLMAADRAQHVTEMILPSLEAGQHVVCDRYSASTRAYQGAGRSLAPSVVEAAIELGECGLIPDLTIVIDVATSLRHERLALRGGSDRMEQAGLAFHDAVAQSFLEQAASTPNMVVIDGSGSIDEVAERVWQAFSTHVAALQCSSTDAAALAPSMEPRTVARMETATSKHAVAHASAQPRQSGEVLAKLITLPDNATVLRAASLLRVDPDLAAKADQHLRSGRVFAAVFSGKMASGKDTVAEKIAELLTETSGQVDVHRTSDPIRAELDEVIRSTAAAKSPEEALASVNEIGYPVHASAHMVEMLFGPTRDRVITAAARTDENRHLLQYLADEGRRSVDPDYWIRQFFLRMLQSLAEGRSAFLSGCRYPNEIGPAQSLGMLTVRLEVSREVQAERLGGRDGLAPNPELVDNPNECALDSYAGFNLVVANDGELEPTLEAVSSELWAHSRRLAGSLLAAHG